MIHEFTTKNGRNLDIDLSKWKIDEHSGHCTIIEINEGNLLLKNKYDDRFTIPEYLINANGLNVIDNRVELPKGLYEYYFLETFRANSLILLDTLYQAYATLIFQNRNLVLNKAENYLLKPSSLSTGFMYSGGIIYSLGNLFESFGSGDHIYYDEFFGYGKMYTYWSSTEYVDNGKYGSSFGAWNLAFNSGDIGYNYNTDRLPPYPDFPKTFREFYVRAVRAF